MNQHYTNTDFLNRIYGNGRDPAMERHLDQCIDCRARWEELASARQQLLNHEPSLSAEFLSAQRQRIHDRIEHSRRSAFFVRWSPAAAVAGMALFVVLWKTPTQRTVTQSVEVATASDAQLMADIYQTVYDSEPDVVEPLHGLFESTKQSTNQ